MRSVNNAVHRYRSTGRVVQGSTRVIEGWSRGRGMFARSARGLLQRRSDRRMLRFVLPVLQQPRHVLDRSAAVFVRPAEMVVVHVAGMVLEAARVLDGAHHAAVHGTG